MTVSSPSYLLMEVVRELGGNVEEALKVARTDLPPREAVERLRESHPAIFAFDARIATLREVTERRDMIEAAYARKAQRAADARFLEQSAAKWAAREARKAAP